MENQVRLMVHFGDRNRQKTIVTHPHDTIHSVKAKACDLFGVSPTQVLLWDYFLNSKYVLLEDQLDSTLAELHMLNEQQLLLEPREVNSQSLTLQLEVHCIIPGSRHEQVCVQHAQPTDTLGSVKAGTCAAFGVDPGCMCLWHFFHYSRHALLEDQLDTSLAELHMCDEQLLLLLEPLQEGMLLPELHTQQQQQQEQQQQQQQQQQMQQQQQRQRRSMHTWASREQSQEAVPAAPRQRSLTGVHEQQGHASSSISSASMAQPTDINAAAAAVGGSGGSAAANNEPATGNAAAELQQLKFCIVCLDAPRSVLLLPCKHLVLCDGCSQYLQQQGSRSTGGSHSSSSRSTGGNAASPCPVCRVPATQHIPGVFLS